MIDYVIQDRIQELENEMGRIAFNELNPIEKLKQTVGAVEDSLTRLKDYVLENPFASPADEIHFFKHVKPQVYCWKIYAFERYSVESWIPKQEDNQIRNFLLGELRTIQRFFRLHDFHYQYYKMQATELDELFFLRGSNLTGSILVPNVGEPDPSFATKGDYLFAKFMALEKLASWIQEQIFGLDGLSPVTIGQARPKNLKWTGESINLVEIAYGLWLTGQINNGNASVSEIVKWMEDSLNVQIGRAYRRWTEISRRDRANSTKYIDRMRDAINTRLEEEDDVSRQRKNNSR